MARQVKNPISIHEDVGLIHVLTQEASIAVSSGVGHRCGSDLALLWLWCRLAVAPPTQFLGTALKRQKYTYQKTQKIAT